MEYVVIAYDGQDEKALERRQNAREKHIAQSDNAIKKGEQIIGAALLDEHKNMRGSVMIVDFDTENDLQNWLKTEPYMTENVWEQVNVIPCKIGPSFEHIKQK